MVNAQADALTNEDAGRQCRTLQMPEISTGHHLSRQHVKVLAA